MVDLYIQHHAEDLQHYAKDSNSKNRSSASLANHFTLGGDNTIKILLTYKNRDKV